MRSCFVDPELLGVERSAAPQPPREAPQGEEHEIQDRHRRAIEVVVVRGDELAQLVDEEAEADAAHDGGHPPHRRVPEDEQDHDGDEHEQPAPQHVGDVEPAAAQLRIAGQAEEAADGEHGGDGDEEQELDRFVGVGIADQLELALHLGSASQALAASISRKARRRMPNRSVIPARPRVAP